MSFYVKRVCSIVLAAVLLISAFPPAALGASVWRREENRFFLHSEELVFDIPDGWVYEDMYEDEDSLRYFTLGNAQDTRTCAAVFNAPVPEYPFALQIFTLAVGPSQVLGNLQFYDDPLEVATDGLTGLTMRTVYTLDSTPILWMAITLLNPNEDGQFYSFVCLVPAEHLADIAWITDPLIRKYPEVAGMLPGDEPGLSEPYNETDSEHAPIPDESADDTADKPAFEEAPAVSHNRDTLYSNESLNADESLISRNGLFTAIVQGDGNFVVYQGRMPLWDSNTVGHPGSTLELHGNGTLVLYNNNALPTWLANTSSMQALVMQDDGNLVGYGENGDVVWAAHTAGIGHPGYEGAYEGEYDADGKRSGYGVWTYYNFIYKGEWKNDKPNGEGTLYFAWEYEGADRDGVTVMQGSWADGLADGPVVYAWCVWRNGAGYAHVVTADADKGFVKTDKAAVGVTLSGDHFTQAVDLCEKMFERGDPLDGVPPWGDIWFDPATSPPPLSLLDELKWDTETILAMIDEAVLAHEAQADTGTYEGAYDADGRRSGYGVWTYYNQRYEGYWENDLPNGPGTLYYAEDTDWADQFFKIVEGNWVNGLAEGEILFSWHYVMDGRDIWDAAVYRLNVSRGIPTEDTHTVGLFLSDGKIAGQTRGYFDTIGVIANVAPWSPANISRVAALPPPGSSIVPGSIEGIQETISTVMIEAAAKDERRATAGTYNGEYDANGQRIGWGIWEYYNCLYAGNWANDKPNGEGTVYRHNEYIYQGETGEEVYIMDEIVHGNWVDGFADGTVDLTWLPRDYSPSTYRVENVKNGSLDREQTVRALNDARESATFVTHQLIGYVSGPWVNWDEEERGGAPWELYEKYPDGIVTYDIRTIENAGMPVSSGNYANRAWEYQAASLGDWVFLGREKIRENAKGNSIAGADGSWLRDISLYKMKRDGSEMTILYEGGSEDYPGLNFQNGLNLLAVGDWLYVNERYKMQAEDITFTPIQDEYIWGRIADQWAYELNTYNDETYATVHRVSLDNTRYEELGRYIKTENAYSNDDLIYIDDDWIYIYRSSYEELKYGSMVVGQQPVNEIVKVAADGSGRTETRLYSHISAYRPPQIAGGRIYSFGAGNTDQGAMDIAFSVDTDFKGNLFAFLILESQQITALHMTEDWAYYATAPAPKSKEKSLKVVRTRPDADAPDHGENQAVLAEFPIASGSRSDRIESIRIEGDWMLLTRSTYGSKSNTTTAYRMRLDGSGFCEWNAPPITEGGLTDSAGKWRYRLLEDGSAMILGMGPKLKPAGKLDIPGKVDKITVTAIGERAFYMQRGFTGLTIPKSITDIGDYAFSGCSGLTSVTLPEGVTAIGDSAFQWCGKLAKVTLPASLTDIGKSAFANCPSIKLSVAKKSEAFMISDGVLYDKVRNKPVE